MDALEVYRASGAASAGGAQRERLSDAVAAFRRIETAPRARRTATMRVIAAERGCSYSTVRRMYYDMRRRGDSAALDARKLRTSSEPKWLQVYLRYAENDKNTGINGWRRMMAEFSAGVEMPFGVGTWRDVFRREFPDEPTPAECPCGWIPAGASYANLQRAAARDPDHLFQTLASRRGMRAAHAALLPVLTTRRGLPVGAVYQFDDVWHNIDIMLPNGRSAQPLEFAGYDVSSAFKMASCMKPRFTREDGTRCNLTEQQFRFLLGYTMCVTGFHRDGVRLVLEHGTTAIRNEVDRQIRTIPGFGDKITHVESGILSEQVHAGLFAGIGGGNFRFKGLVETSHNILHNREASLPGNRGRDAAHMHESRDALVKYEERTVAAAAAISPETVARLRSGLLSFGEYAQAFSAIEASLMDDPVHRLEGWDGREVAEYRLGRDAEWRPVSELEDAPADERAAILAYVSLHPECRRRRWMSRREAWLAGRRDLIHVPLFDMPAFLSASDALELTVRPNGMIGIRSELWFGRDEMTYRAEAHDIDGAVRRFAPGEKMTVKWNPMTPDQVWIIDRDGGGTLGVAPLYNRAPIYDRHAIEIAMGEQAHDLARKVLPVRGRHQAEAEDRAARMAHNATVLQTSGKTTADVMDDLVSGGREHGAAADMDDLI